MNKSIYDLGLHETINITGFKIMRVPGGWIYYSWIYAHGNYETYGTFVPFDDDVPKST